MRLHASANGLVVFLALAAVSYSKEARPPVAAKPPGTVVDYVSASDKLYVGSPALAILPNGDYVAAHDLFGPKSTEHISATTRVFGSSDRGKSWKHLTDLEGQFWSSLFVHKGVLHILGTNKHYGSIVIRRSDDGGKTWTEPKDKDSGRLFEDDTYHCAPVPVVVHKGRIWRAFEAANPALRWGGNFRPTMISAPVDADLLKASSWAMCNKLEQDRTWLGGDFSGWLEGNAVVSPDGKMLDILRVA